MTFSDRSPLKLIDDARGLRDAEPATVTLALSPGAIGPHKVDCASSKPASHHPGTTYNGSMILRPMDKPIELIAAYIIHSTQAPMCLKCTR